MINMQVNDKMRDADGLLKEIESIVTLTSDGKVALLKPVDNTEQLIVACLVAQYLAHRGGRASKPGLSVDEIIGAGGLAQRVARQTVYNSVSKLSKSKIIEKIGGEFSVDERAVLQFFATMLPNLRSR
jgi:hypothetical protein